MESGIFDQGLNLMLVGMGTVFAFLTVLVAATSIMSVLIVRLTPVKEDAAATHEEIAAISAALAKHRRQ
jgi:oxaloacetate decarboxylase gamma subunit